MFVVEEKHRSEFFGIFHCLVSKNKTENFQLGYSGDEVMYRFATNKCYVDDLEYVFKYIQKKICSVHTESGDCCNKTIAFFIFHTFQFFIRYLYVYCCLFGINISGGSFTNVK